MLTLKNVTSLQARDYYDKGYYGRGRWYGRGAFELGLSGYIHNRSVYRNLLDGYSPDRSRPLTGRRLDPTKHRAALDCTFNAPKSVSLLALVAADARLSEAHRRAVRRTLDLVEERHAVARVVGPDGFRREVNTGNLVIARFDHIETRDFDPHLHTHCVVMNFTRLPDGRWRGLHNDDIYRHRVEIGMFYQHELAGEVGKLGYEVIPREHGQFEIAGFAEKDLESFSKRRRAILAKAGENATFRGRERAWADTRARKRIVAPGDLKVRWREEAAGLGIEFPVPGRPIVQQDTPVVTVATSIDLDRETTPPEPEPETSVVPTGESTGDLFPDANGSLRSVTSPTGVIPNSLPPTPEEENPWREIEEYEVFPDELDFSEFFEDLSEEDDLEL